MNAFKIWNLLFPAYFEPHSFIFLLSVIQWMFNRSYYFFSQIRLTFEIFSHSYLILKETRSTYKLLILQFFTFTILVGHFKKTNFENVLLIWETLKLFQQTNIKHFRKWWLLFTMFSNGHFCPISKKLSLNFNSWKKKN